MIKQRVDRLLAVIYVMTKGSYLEKVHVVFVSVDGEYEFVEVAETEEFENTAAILIENDFLALGLIGWKIGLTYVQARKHIFPWHEDDHLHAVLQGACEAGVDNVERLLEEKPKKLVN